MSTATYQNPLKFHVFDKVKNGTACRANPRYVEYAKRFEEIDCKNCKKIADEIIRTKKGKK